MADKINTDNNTNTVVYRRNGVLKRKRNLSETETHSLVTNLLQQKSFGISITDFEIRTDYADKILEFLNH